MLSRTAIADPEASQVHPVRKFGFALSFLGRFGSLGGVAEGGSGPNLELALGAGRTQYFVEGGVAWMQFGLDEPGDRGFMLRGALGARYIARSFGMQRDAALEMTLDGLVGVEKTWWNDEQIVRPEFAFGVGLQARKFADPAFVIRFSLRVFFAPTDDEPALAARTTTPQSGERTDAGLMMLVGVGR